MAAFCDLARSTEAAAFVDELRAEVRERGRSRWVCMQCVPPSRLKYRDGNGVARLHLYPRVRDMMASWAGSDVDALVLKRHLLCQAGCF